MLVGLDPEDLLRKATPEEAVLNNDLIKTASRFVVFRGAAGVGWI